MGTSRLAYLELSKLMLGTAQFGLNYGIANRTGQPSYESVKDILACAYEGGVNCLDTAAIYGTSEEVLGKALADLGIKNRMIVVTKVDPMDDDIASSQAADRIVERSVNRSLKRLGLDYLPVCLFHIESNYRYVESLLKLRDNGLIRHIGASVNTVGAARGVISSDSDEAVQVPTNLLDQRFTRSGLLRDAADAGRAVFVRSAYLQGLLLMPEEEIIEELREVVPIRRKLGRLASEAGISLAELAIRYVLSLSGTTCVIVGVDSVDQMRENIALFSRGVLDQSLMQAIGRVVPDLPERILVPTNWSRRMPDPTLKKG